MLNGVAPILIFHFYNKDVAGLLSGIPFGAEIGDAVGIPVPIYLDERITGIYVDSESRGVDLVTEVEPVLDKDPTTGEVQKPQVKQTALDSQITVYMFARRDSIMLTAFLALSDMVLSRVVSQEYGITYLNKSTTIFNGLLQRFSTSNGADDDLIRIEMTFSNAKQEGTQAAATASAATTPPIPKVTGAVPL